MTDEQRIKELKEEITALEKQRKILFDFTELVPDAVSAIQKALANSNLEERNRVLQLLQDMAFKAMKDFSLAKKPLI